PDPGQGERPARRARGVRRAAAGAGPVGGRRRPARAAGASGAADGRVGLELRGTHAQDRRAVRRDVAAHAARAGVFAKLYWVWAGARCIMIVIRELQGRELVAAMPRLEAYVTRGGRAALTRHPARPADELRVRYLELRHESPHQHPSLTGKLISKVHL